MQCLFLTTVCYGFLLCVGKSARKWKNTQVSTREGVLMLHPVDMMIILTYVGGHTLQLLLVMRMSYGRSFLARQTSLRSSILKNVLKTLFLTQYYLSNSTSLHCFMLYSLMVSEWLFPIC